MWEVYPFVLKAYRLFRDADDKTKILAEIFRILEIIAFRDKLVQTKADLASRLSKILKNFNSAETLIEGLKKICEDEPWYWGDGRMSEKLVNIFTENKGILPYLFMRYENFLSDKDAKTRGYNFKLKIKNADKNVEIEKPQIEHIAPQTETIEKSGKKRASGYCQYDKEFNEEYMNCIGNLVLISGSHNASIGNEPFSKKLESYGKSKLSQQREIKDFVKKDIWDKDAIDDRHEKLEKFVLDTWSFE